MMSRLKLLVYALTLALLTSLIIFGTVSSVSAQNNEKYFAAQSGFTEVYIGGEAVGKYQGTVYIIQGEEFKYEIHTPTITPEMLACVSREGVSGELCEVNSSGTVVSITDEINEAGRYEIQVRSGENNGEFEQEDELAFSVEIIDGSSDFDNDGVENIEEVRKGTDFTTEDSGGDYQSQSDPNDQIAEEEPNRGFITNNPEESPSFLNNPLNLTTIGLILSIIGIILELRRGV